MNAVLCRSASFWSPKAYQPGNVGSRPDNSTRITSFVQSLLLKAGLNTEQVAQLESKMKENNLNRVIGWSGLLLTSY